VPSSLHVSTQDQWENCEELLGILYSLRSIITDGASVQIWTKLNWNPTTFYGSEAVVVSISSITHFSFGLICCSPTSQTSCYIYFACDFPVQFASHLSPTGGNYYGLHVTMSVYGHKLKPGQVTSTIISVTHSGDGARSSFNAIQVGWHVSVTCPIHDFQYNSHSRLNISINKTPQAVTMQ
jgi:hypothetical protein